MNAVIYKKISGEEAGQRLDNYLIRTLKGVPKSHLYRIIRSGEIRVNKKRAKADFRLSQDDIVRIPPVRTSSTQDIFVGDTLATRLQKSIIYEDSSLLVLNKPAGIAVHGGSGLNLGIIEALRKIRSDLPYLELVHRLDKDTSGCLLLAKKRSVLRALHSMLEAREIEKTYWALLTKRWTGKKTRIVQTGLEKNTLKSGEWFVSIRKEGKASETHFQLLENYSQACWVKAIPKTGRTHQIRVHSAFLGHVIFGDKKYGSLAGEVEGVDNQPNRLYLHAREIQFTLNDKKYFFQADLDEVFEKTIKQLQGKVTGNE